MIQWNTNEAADLYLDQQWTYEQLASRYGISTATVWQKLSSHPSISAFRKHKRDRLNQHRVEDGQSAILHRKAATDEQMLAWSQGEDLNSIATKAGVSVSTMQGWIGNHPRHAALRLVRRDNRKSAPTSSKVDRTECARLYDEERWTIYRLSDKYGVSHQRIQQIMSRYYPEIMERRRAAIVLKATLAAEKSAVKKAIRESTDKEYETAVDLYGQGFTIRELRIAYQDMNWSTFNLRVTKRRAVDPTFPSERARGGSSDWNWAPRMIAAINSSKNYTEAAKLLNINYGSFMNRVYKMRAKGLIA
jgi:hypothetical protein